MSKVRRNAIRLGSLILAAQVQAGFAEENFDYHPFELSQVVAEQPVILADAGAVDRQTALKIDHSDFEESWWTGNKFHQYAGLGALALVGMAALSPKEEDGPHEYFATAASALGAAAVTTGLIFHWDDFDLSDGFTDPDNLHVMMAGLGALAMAYAVSEAPDSGHAGIGSLGGIAMGLAIKIEW